MFSRIFTLILLLIAFQATAQRGGAQRDLIITQAGEQIRCRIVDESSMRFSYIYVNEKGRPVKTEIFKTLISSFKYNYFPEDLPSGEKGASPAGNRPAVSAGSSKTDRKPESPAANVPVRETLPHGTGNGTVPGEATVKKEDRGEKQEELARKESKNPPAGEIKGVPAATAENRTGKVASASEKKPEEYMSPLKGKTEFTNYLKYRIGFKGGLGNIIDENDIKSDWGLFNEKLRRGWVYGVDAAVFLNDHIGVGVTYHSYQSSNKNGKFDFPNRVTGEDFRTGSLESKVNHKFVGPTLLGRIGMDYKTFIVATVSPGYYFYSDKGLENQMNYVYKGGTWGGAATLGIDFLLGNNETGRDVILSFECGYNYGQLKSLDYGGTTGRRDLATPVQLSRLDFAVGLRFTRFPRYLR